MRKLREIARQAARKREREEQEKAREEQEAQKRQTRSKTQEKKDATADKADKEDKQDDMMSDNDPDAEEDEGEMDDLAPAVDSKEYLEIHLMTRTHPSSKKFHGVKKGSAGNPWFGKGEETLADLQERIWNEHQGGWMAHYKMKAL